MTDMMIRPASVSADPSSRADRVLPRFDVVASETPAESVRREHEIVDALPDCAHTDHAAPEALRAGDAAAPHAERALLAEAMCGCPIRTTAV
ncbi:MAG: hypothetical protein JWN84_349 [Nocardioides sp.]|jgi:hypothetical protein|nr:hypothetical protein [Nocardioides sp.]